MLNACTTYTYHIMFSLPMLHPLFANNVSTGEMELNADNIALDANEAHSRREEAIRFLLGAATGPVARRPQGLLPPIQAIIQNAMANQMAAIEYMEAQRRNNPEWAKYYESNLGWRRRRWGVGREMGERSWRM